MVELLDSWLGKHDIGLEFGAGRSTLWLAGRVKNLISVEHDPEWHEKVKGELRKNGTDKQVKMCLFEDGKFEKSESEYVNVAREIEDGTLDFCLVDGNARDHCALASVDKIKPGGILIVDDVERYIPRNKKTRSPNARSVSDGFSSEGWKNFAELVKGWRCVWTTNGIKDSALWMKPGKNQLLVFHR